MKLLIRFWVFGLLVLSSVICRAETRSFTHNFNDMIGPPSEISFNPTNTVATTSEVTYTCNGKGAEFGADLYSAVGKQVLSINLTKKGNFVTTSRLERLQKLAFKYYRAVSDPNIIVQLSTDSVSWSEPLVNEASLTFLATFPTDDYYVRITYNTTANISIWQITYTFELCPNCFIYEPE